jgi:SAM-dependent methyltransferase
MDMSNVKTEAFFRYLTKRSKFSQRFRKPFIKDLARHLSGKVLDIGSGAGEFLSYIPGCMGVELDPHLAVYCRQKGLTVCCSDIHHLPFLEGAFDGVLVSNVLEHLVDPELALQEATRVLKHDGALVISVPFSAGYRRDPTHQSFITSSDLDQLVAGLHLNPVKRYSFPSGGAFFGRMITFFELHAVFQKNRVLSHPDIIHSPDIQ